MLTTR
ncbi:hypothetical protein RDI58_016501 [Solanum bulbocastanum]